MTVLVCGEALYDMFVAQEIDGGFLLEARIGGSALNVASGLARLGGDVALLTGVSNDRFGDRLVEFMDAEGIGTGALKRTDARSTLALVGQGADGSPRYSFYGEGAADRQVEDGDVPPLDDVSALVFGCFSLLTRPTGDTFLSLARSARARPRPPLVVLDPNVRLAVEPDPAVWRTRIADFVAEADLVKVSREDLQMIYGATGDATVAEWLGGRVSAVAVTEGGDGSQIVTRGGSVRVDAPRIDVVDTVGAGDTYLAALLTALRELDLCSASALTTLSPTVARRVLHFATAAAALTCSRRGADLPRRADLPAL